MTKFFGRFFNIYKNEISLFVWTTILLFLVRTCGIYLNNYAETAFLKRYGVEYLPIVNMLNAVATFFIMGAMTGIIARLPGVRLLARIFVFCGASVVALRLVIPFGYDLVYPLLFMLKSQYEVLQALLFWNLANDLFNTRQSKRLFPLVTAGGIVGQILASFSTPIFVSAFSIDNLLYIYLIITLLGALVVRHMGSRFPTLLSGQTGASQKAGSTKSKEGMVKEFKKIIPMLKSSPLIMLMILLTFLPNVVIPIMNYQFNFAVNDQFGSEQALIQFFSYFRGVLNIVSLVILLFVGRIYGRWGLPVALMFHPFNYMVVFLAFLFRFDAFTAIYARMSSNVIRSTINIPAMAVVTGLFPESYRNLVRPFLRGTVVRIALFLGSGLILLSTNLFHPRYLSLVALPFVIAWVITPFVLKRRYARILLDLISHNMFDMKSFDPKEIQQLFSDKSVGKQLIQAFMSATKEDCLWFGNMMQSLQFPDLNSHVIRKIDLEKDVSTKTGLLDLLSSPVPGDINETFERWSSEAPPDLLVALVRTAGRIAPNELGQFIANQFDSSTCPETRGYAAATLYENDKTKYHPIILQWLDADSSSERLAGVIAAGRTGHTVYGERLTTLLAQENENQIKAEILTGLRRLDVSKLNKILFPYLSHHSESVRMAALKAYDIHDDDNLRTIFAMLADPSPEIVSETKEKVIRADYQNDQFLLESLSIPKRKVREGLFHLIERMEIKDFDMVQFTRRQIEKSYFHLAEAEAVTSLPPGEIRQLLHQHLMEQHRLPITNTLRVLSILDPVGEIKKIQRGLNAADPHQRGNSVEALENLLEKPLAKILIPLVEDMEPAQQLAVGKKHFNLPLFGKAPMPLIRHLADRNDWVALALLTAIVNKMTAEEIDKKALSPYLYLPAAGSTQESMTITNENVKNEGMKMADLMTIPDKIIQLRKVEILKDLDVSELAAVAAIAEEAVFPADEIVIEEGEMSQVLYLVIEGETSVIKNYGSEREMELARISANDYFGEMALLEDGRPRSASIRTEKPSRFLSLQKQELVEIINEYPKIALNFCRVLTRRLRTLDEKTSALECAPEKLT